MNTVQLECFVTLARTLNFMLTAKEMHITQPTVSKQIRTLEEELGVKLFYRTTHCVVLTEVGRSFLKDAETVLRVLQEAQNRIRIAEKTKACRFGIGYTDPSASELLRKILQVFLADHAFVPALEMGETTSNLEKLSSNMIDVVLAIRDARFSSSSISFFRLYDEKFYCVMRKDHPLYHEGMNSVSEEAFNPHRAIIFIPQYLLDHSFARGRTLFPVNDELENIFVHSAEEAILLVKAGLGYALLPYYQTMGVNDIAVVSWAESPRVPFGIYYRTLDENKESIRRFLSVAERVTKQKRDNFCPLLSD